MNKKRRTPNGKPGAMVCLKSHSRKRAMIESSHPEVAPGAVYLDRQIDGLQWWNMEELRYCPEALPKHSPLRKLPPYA